MSVAEMMQPDFYERLNAAHAEAGWPPIEDFAGIDWAASAMGTQNARHIALAEETIDAHRHQLFLRGGRRKYASQPTEGALYAILARSPYKLYPTTDPETFAAGKLWPYRKMLDKMRAEDPAKAKEFVTFVRRMFAEFGKEPPYPFR